MPKLPCAAAVALLACACGRSGPSAPAPQEQVLNIYNWADYIGNHTIAEFERATHIKVVYQTYDSNETLEAVLMAGHSGFDIVSTTTAFYGPQIRAGAYLPLDKSKLPNFANIDPQVLAVQAQADPAFEMRKVVDFTNQVMTEDAEVCELNQRGLRARAHLRGVVMPEEYVVRQFHEWVGLELARA